MDTHALRRMLRNIDIIPVEDMTRRYGLLCELIEYVKREANSPAGSSLDSNKILLKLLNSIEAIPPEQQERRYFQMVSLMIYLKRQALLDPTYESVAFRQTAI